MGENSLIGAAVETNKSLLYTVERCIYYFRKLSYDKALRLFVAVNHKLENLLGLLFKTIGTWTECGVELNPEEIGSLLKTLLDVQKQKDYILLADLLEQQLKPWLISLQETAYNYGAEEFSRYCREECFHKNLEAVRIYYGSVEKGRELLKELERGIPSLREGEFQLEYTSSGDWTCLLEQAEGSWYLHSNVSPAMEGFLLAEDWFEQEIENYGIYGFGLGYAVRALFEKSEYIHITVYESNASLLRLAMELFDYTDMLESGRFELYYLPQEEKLPEKFGGRQQKLIIYEPELKLLKKEELRQKLENYFLQVSSVENQKILLNGNFKRNSARRDPSIDQLSSEFQEKDLYIIAAGPSLDKNYQLLLKLREIESGKKRRSIILATGTVFKKLLAAGIRPDYVLVTDANRRVLFQIKDVETETIPMLYLSTAYYGFAERYHGKKYIVCQSEFPQSEEYAAQMGFPLVRTGGSVSTTALDIGLTLRCGRIIFLGLDLSYPQGFAHAEGTSSRVIHETEGLRMIPDIHGALTPTSKSMDIYRQWIEQRIADEKQIPILDATEGGAKIQGMKVVTMRGLVEEAEQNE